MHILKWKGLDVDPVKITESIITKPEIGQIDTAFNESTNDTNITMLFPRIEAIHAGRTRNFNHYLAEKLKGDPDLKSGVYSWTSPYPKPVIHNHDIETEATGRVYSASYSEFTAAGGPGIIVTPKITQEKAIKDILEGRLLTVSIGASTNAAVCSICGTDIINEGFCGHMRGEEYDGQVTEWIAGDLWFDELSWVNVPADSDAMITMTDVNAATADISASKESVKSNTKSQPLTTEQIVVKSVVEKDEKEEKEMAEESKNETTETVEDVKEETEVEETAGDEKPEETKTKEEATTEEVSVEETATSTKEETDLDSLKQELQESKETIQELEEANTLLAEELNKTIAEILVDIRVSLGKESNREEAMEKYASRTVESLKDSISDLLGDKPLAVKKEARQKEEVEKPQGDTVITESKTLATQEERVISNEDVLIKLLSGNKK